MNYEMIDRFLRNNLDDDAYAKYSAALEALVAQPVSEDCTHFSDVAQRDALLAANRKQALDLLAASTREIELQAEVERLRNRLEASDMDPYDGIDTRDETIRMLEDEVERLRGLQEPTPEMIEAGAQALVSWENGSVWPDSWGVHANQHRRDARKCYIAMQGAKG